MLTPRERLVERNLADDEQVIFNEAPDLRACIAAQWLELLVVVLVLVIIVATGDATVGVVGLLGEIALLGLIMSRLTRKVYTRYVLTDRRAILMSGVFRRDHEWISWRKITDVSVHRSVLDRLFGTATIRIQSANELSGFKAMVDVPNPVAFAETIASYVSAARPGTTPAASGGPSGGGSGWDPDLGF